MRWLNKIRAFLPQEIVGVFALLYDKVAAPGLREFHGRVASEVASGLTEGRVLDVGTGPGYLLAAIAKLSPDLQLVGVDLSRKMLGIARRTTERIGVPSPQTGATDRDEAVAGGSSGPRPIRLLRADVRDLPFEDGTFNVVISTLSLHHWHDPARGIRECFRVTAPGGQCWIYDLRTDAPARMHANLVTGGGFARWARGWIFKFHGVDPTDYKAQSVSEWLGGGAVVETEVHPAYLKLIVRKDPGRPDRQATGSARDSRFSEDRPSATGPEPSESHEGVLA